MVQARMQDSIPINYIGQQHNSCWEFIRKYYADHGAEIPEYAYLATMFVPVKNPENGDLALIYGAAHCGIFHAGKIYHHIKSMGVICDKRTDFESAVYYRLRQLRGSVRPDTPACS